MKYDRTGQPESAKKLSDAQFDALEQAITEPLQLVDDSYVFALRWGVRLSTARALRNLGLTDSAGRLTSDGERIAREIFAYTHEGHTPEQRRKLNAEAEAREKAEERLEEERRNAKVRKITEAFRGIKVQPFGSANFALDDVDLADEMHKYFVNSNSTTVTLQLEHVEAIAKAMQS